MPSAKVVLACCVSAAVMSTAPQALEQTAASASAGPFSIASARVSLEGTSTLHPYTASSTTVLVTAADIAGTPEGDLLDHVLQPGGLKAFEVTIPVLSLSSPRDGIDKNMHKALKAHEHTEIRFRLRALEAAGTAYRATGLLTIAGIEKEVALDLQIQRKGAQLAVTGGTGLLMTDYGIAPPKAMMGMIKTDPKVQIRIELLLGAIS
jgi:polyisoprenoid-binding protein YceI